MEFLFKEFWICISLVHWEFIVLNFQIGCWRQMKSAKGFIKSVYTPLSKYDDCSEHYLLHLIWTLNGSDDRLLGTNFGGSILKIRYFRSCDSFFFMNLHLFIAQIKIIALTHWIDVCSVTKSIDVIVRYVSDLKLTILMLKILMFSMYILLGKVFDTRLLVSSSTVRMRLCHLANHLDFTKNHHLFMKLPDMVLLIEHSQKLVWPQNLPTYFSFILTWKIFYPLTLSIPRSSFSLLHSWLWFNPF